MPKLWVASEMTTSNRRQIDQGVSGYWLYHVETTTATDNKGKLQLILHKITKQAHSDGTGNSRYCEMWRESLVLPKVSLPSYITALPCSCCGTKKTAAMFWHQAHTYRPDKSPTVPGPYDFSQHSISKGVILLTEKYRYCKGATKPDVLTL